MVPGFLILVLSACTGKQEGEEQGFTRFEDAPRWSTEVVWYQIYPERFRNGDPTNDPTPVDMKGSYPGFVPEGWVKTPWTHDWYKPDPWFPEVLGKIDIAGDEITHFFMASRLRRYGGDLQGVIDKIDYLDSLGVTAIYFNPLNDAPSVHNFDARNWRHIDRNFGPTPRKDAEIMASEVPDDPSTWQMTGADKMFIDLVDRLHERGIRVIMDYSWNHVGYEFWAFKDVRENQENSEYADWFWISSFDDPETPENELDYPGWFNVKDLILIKETEWADHSGHSYAWEGNLASEAAK
jgi:glycosidase